MARGILFYYLGDDEAYFRALQTEFRRHTRMAIDFKRIYESSEAKIQSLFLKVYKEKPNCIFIDFSKQTQDYLHLARILSRTPLEEQPILIGLVDYLSPPEVHNESVTTGMNLTYIKSAEIYDVIYDVTKLIAPNEISGHGFATATLKEDWEGGLLCKVGHVNGQGIHIETNHRISKGERLRLNHHWLEKRVVPSKDVFVKDVSTSNLFYHFKYNAELEFLFVDEFLPPEGMEPDKIKEKKQERDDLIVYHKKQLSRWVDANREASQEKKAKVLVIDREFHFYQDQARTDKHPYTIRCLPYFNEISVDLERLVPQVIAFALDGAGVADPKNTKETLGHLISILKSKYASIQPFVVVFNGPTSKELQDTYQYSHLMGHSSELSVEVLVKMADIFEKKLANESMPAKKESTRVFIKKNSPASVAEILTTVKVLKLSETDMIFQSETEFPIGTNLHFTSPVDMFVNIQPSKTQGKVPEYVGLIHCLGEEAKKELRRYVNSVFFRDHDAQVQAENEEFKKLNEAKLQEKMEVQLKKEEETKSALEANVKDKAEEPQ